MPAFILKIPATQKELATLLKPGEGPSLEFKRSTNPLIAETFHRTGAVEVWGRGTNRVILSLPRLLIPYQGQEIALPNLFPN